MTTGWTNHQI